MRRCLSRDQLMTLPAATLVTAAGRRIAKGRLGREVARFALAEGHAVYVASGEGGFARVVAVADEAGSSGPGRRRRLVG
jgi:hypothetical protein